jgi:multicomponent Na+:H+ antiporter subunit E
MSRILMTFVLALGWAAATGSFTLFNLLVGAALGALALFVVRDRVVGPHLGRRLARIGALALHFVIDLVLSATRVALLVIRPDMQGHLKPAIVAFPLAAKSDAEITLLANIITLTPGTLSLDVSADRKYLYVHAVGMDDREKLISGIAGGFEARVIEVFR